MNYKKEFVKTFNSLCLTRNAWNVWADFICAVACTFSNMACCYDLANFIDKDTLDARKKEADECYKRIDVNTVAKLLVIIKNAYKENPDQDFLGEVYMELGLGNKYKGQFFTPYNLCKLISAMNLCDISEQYKDKGWISVNDCACGAGALLIAAANYLKKTGYNYTTDVMFAAQDIDRVTGLMCYIQLCVLNCTGYVCIGDSLSNPLTVISPLIVTKKEGQELWYTPTYFSQVWFDRMVEEVSHLEFTEKK